MTKATLNYATREAFTPGTDEFGQANVKMALDFASDVFVDTLQLAAMAHKMGQIDTCLISIRNLCRVVYDELLEQDKDFARLWGSTWGHLVCNETFLGFFFNAWENIIFIDQESAEQENVADWLLYLDIDALAAAAGAA